MTFTPTAATPTGTNTLHAVKLAVDAGTDVKFVFRSLGFHVTSIGATASLAGYGGAGGPAGSGKVVYIGFAPAFRAYPEGQFRLLANAIWYGMK